MPMAQKGGRAHLAPVNRRVATEKVTQGFTQKASLFELGSFRGTEPKATNLDCARAHLFVILTNYPCFH